ncbi:MAG: hypothetical protein IAF58_21320 [Leptolyngbya sp.]|nr:hypothetical protein [Candidatus Melainabacteria bacterium]
MSPSLIRNLLEFQNYWYSVLPQKYGRIEFQCDSQNENPAISEDRSICAFTGGIDSTYSIYRHASGVCGQMKRKIEAALFVHGFDIPLSDKEAYNRAFATNQETLDFFKIKLFGIETNHKELNPDWNYTHGAGIASSLSFFQKHFSEGIIPATYTYPESGLAWGSNPVSDHFMSSRSFSIFHDGAVWGRGFKLIPLKEWKFGYDRMRVCYSAEEKDKNCGRCGKCVITMLTATIFKCPLPESFPHALNKELFDNMDELDEVHLLHLENMSKMYSMVLPFKTQIQRVIKANKQRLEQVSKRERTKFHFQMATEKLKKLITPKN